MTEEPADEGVGHVRVLQPRGHGAARVMKMKQLTSNAVGKPAPAQIGTEELRTVRSSELAVFSGEERIVGARATADEFVPSLGDPLVQTCNGARVQWEFAYGPFLLSSPKLRKTILVVQDARLGDIDVGEGAFENDVSDS